MWLRDNCACAECRDPRNGQKLFQITDLPQDLAVAAETAAEVDGAPGWEVVWSPDGHRSRYADAWLGEPEGGSGGPGWATGVPRTARSSGSRPI